ncbi:hypothetical protein PILCRDRAFT_248113 [Piloderma croceum F 1598]|uniref:RING-type domain-containing protein n=1 Tax=Piloderma croceum (strain F 1598) TaxID=765440 RepID=A0A0C3G8R1_PILCF|nr:hypothetical protein PILCRDRAFT_248113 [Piloderma croceum F 1598]
MTSFTPSSAELGLVTQIIAKADSQKLGLLTGDAALKVFEGTKLPPTILREIWSIADEGNNGWLAHKEVAIAVRLMGWAQKGEVVTKALINKPGPLPTIEGIQTPCPQQNTGILLSPTAPFVLPVLTLEDKAKYMGLFQSCKPKDGLLSSQQARDVFMKFMPAGEMLDQIWDLAAQNRDSLGATDFAIGMHLIKASMSGQFSCTPPTSISPLYEQVSGSETVSRGTDHSGHFSSRPSSARTAPQYGSSTLQAPTNGLKGPPPILPSTRPTAPVQVPITFGHATSQFSTGQPAWDISAAGNTSVAMPFATLDLLQANHIEGDVAVPFMLQSNLPVDNDDILASLPQGIVPPPMLGNATTFSGPPPQVPVNTLWGGTASPFVPPVPAQKQFSPRPMSPLASGVSSSSHNLIDNELTARLAPLREQSGIAPDDQFQLNLANASLRTAKAECDELKEALAKRAAQISSLQDRLYSANTAKENGEQLLSVQKSEIQKTREELRRAEGDLNVLRFEKEETETSFQTLRAEITDLKFQNSRLGSENKRLETVMSRMANEYREERRKIMQSSRNRESMFLRQASGSAGIANAVAGPSHITFQQFQPSPAYSPHISLYWNSIPREHSVHPPNQRSSKSTVAALKRRESDERRLREQQEELAKNIQCLFECGVCMDEHPEDYVTLLDPCGHKFCRDCIRNHIGAKLAEHYFPVLCPVCMAEEGKSDPGVITDIVAKQAGITEQQYETWLELEMAEFSVPLHCRECERSFSVDRQDLEDTDTISCPLQECNHVWCKLCQQSISQDGPEHSCDGQAELDHLMQQRGWKYCPNCKTPIEKGMGCNHMTCISPGCNTHFCYKCGDSIIKSSLPSEINAATSAHFRSCNMFEDVSEDEDDGDYVSEDEDDDQ